MKKYHALVTEIKLSKITLKANFKIKCYTLFIDLFK